MNTRENDGEYILLDVRNEQIGNFGKVENKEIVPSQRTKDNLHIR